MSDDVEYYSESKNEINVEMFVHEEYSHGSIKTYTYPDGSSRNTLDSVEDLREIGEWLIEIADDIENDVQ